MYDLIKIRDNNGQQVVSARDLWQFLESKKDFSDWVKNRIQKYGLLENQDYTIFHQTGEKGRPSVEYALTLDAAKELAMVEGNAKGKQARQYFIECEKKLKEVARPMSALDIMEMSIKQLREQEARIGKVEEKVLEIEAKTATRPDYFTVAGYAIKNRIKIGLNMANRLGRAAAKICKDRGWPIDRVEDPRWGEVGAYPREALQEVFEIPVT